MINKKKSKTELAQARTQIFSGKIKTSTYDTKQRYRDLDKF